MSHLDARPISTAAAAVKNESQKPTNTAPPRLTHPNVELPSTRAERSPLNSPKCGVAEQTINSGAAPASGRGATHVGDHSRSHAPAILRSLEDMRSYRAAISSTDKVGFVPTMGALHDGHAHLLKKLRARCDKLVLSIFVNPTQFGPNEDLAKYPRTFDADLEIACREGVDAVFFPTPEQIYPTGFSTYVEESSLTQPLCGPFRPGHFRGVTTVVLKLFNLVKPHTAYFGLKDAQQFFVLHKMARDLDLDVSVEGVATVREPDGLAMSSRNRYLSATERTQALAIHSALKQCANALSIPTHTPASAAADDRSILRLETSIGAARSQLEAQGFKVQYLECLELPGFASIGQNPGSETNSSKSYLIATAAYLGNTRLIDNLIVRPEALEAHGFRLHLK